MTFDPVTTSARSVVSELRDKIELSSQYLHVHVHVHVLWRICIHCNTSMP